MTMALTIVLTTSKKVEFATTRQLIREVYWPTIYKVYRNGIKEFHVMCEALKNAGCFLFGFGLSLAMS
jgi:hypothetical protein